MDRSVFCPPNSHFLSDSVIGSLTTHHTSPLSLQVRTVSSRSNNRSSSLAWKPHEQLRSAGWKSMEDGENVSLLDRAHESSEENDGSSLRQEDVKETANPTDKEDVREERRRKKRCEIQRRYRKRQAEHISKLVNQVHRLRKDIKELQQERGSMRAIVIVNRDVWNIALAYYARLRRVNNQDARSQLEFLKTTMASDVAFNGGFGSNGLAESWTIFQWFDDVQVDPQSLVKHDKDSVVMTTRTSMTISKWTLENLFPHLGKLGRHVERNSVKDTVAEKLVDQRIVVDGRTMFHWDCGTEAIASVMVDNDFLTPILELLGSLEEVSEVFEDALVSPNLQWRSIS